MSRTQASPAASPEMVDVADIFGSLSPDEFKSHYFNNKSVYVPGPAGRFDGIIHWEQLSDLLDSLQYPNDDIRLVRNLEYRNCNSLRELRRGLSDGYTLVFNNVHERFKPVGELAERLGGFFQEPTQVNLYLSHPSNNGFALHYDNHDVLVFQIAGTKKWEVLPPTVEKPVVLMKEHQSDAPSASPYLVASLNSGDLLYIPRGHWHFAKPESSVPSLHLTLGILSRTGLDFLDWLRGELSDSPLWRDSFTFNRQAHSTLLVQSLADELRSDQLFERFNEHCAMNLWKTRHLGLPYCYTDLTDLKIDDKIVCIPPLLPVIKKVENGTIVLLFNNTRVVLNDLAEALIDYLLTREPLDLAKFHTFHFKVAHEQALELVRKLAAAELLRVYQAR